MKLTAYHTETAKDIIIFDNEEVNKNREFLVCGECFTPLIPRRGEINRWHFAHKAENREKRCSSSKHDSESLRHYDAKHDIYFILKNAGLDPYVEQIVRLEEGYIRPDLSCRDTHFEIVHSQASESVRRKRVKYTEAGLKNIWIHSTQPEVVMNRGGKHVIKWTRQLASCLQGKNKDILFYMDGAKLSAVKITPKVYGLKMMYWFISKPSYNNVHEQLINSLK